MPVATPSCADTLASLYNAILALQKGETATNISFGERSVTYVQSNLSDLLKLYALHWRLCGADSGLPEMSAAAMVERGPPALIRF